MDGIKFQKHEAHHGPNHHAKVDHKPKLYLILNDHVNFYKIDLSASTTKVVTFESKLSFHNASLD